MKNLAYTLVIILAASSCAKKLTEENELSVSNLTAEVESGATAVSSVLDEQNGTGYAMATPAHNSIFEVLVSKSYAATCIRPYHAVCNSGIKSASYDGCEVGAFSLTGTAQLQYSQSNCSMNVNGDTVTRTYNLLRAGPRGGNLSVSSSDKSDYRGGAAYGGGGRLTKTVGGFNLEILGKHKVLTFRSRTVYDVSIKTLSALQVTGGLDRSNRTITSGQLEINHNKAGQTAVWSFNNVQYSSSCCHPVSGTIDINWSGAKSGSAQMTFQGCGLAQVTEGGQTTQVEMSYCE